MTQPAAGGYDPGPPPPPPGPFARFLGLLRTTRGIVSLIVVALVAVAVVALWPWASWSPVNPCAGVHRTFGGLCIGVSDSSDFGDPRLDPVMNAIGTENASITGDFYTIGYLVPLEDPDNQTTLSAELRHELQGALIAQLRANRTSELGGGPKIKLLVGNAGPDNESWSDITSRFISSSQSSDRLRAVVGMGTSLETTEAAIQELTRKDDGHPPIATIAARLTADDLSLDPATSADPGLFRIAPRNIDEVLAGVDYIHSIPALRPLLIRDRLQDDGYVKSLGDGFRQNYGADTPEATYDSSQDGLANAMDSIVKNICGGTYQPDVVYFAGRGDALSTFVDLLSDRPCPRLTIVTGDDISGVRDKAAAGEPATRAALQRHVIVYAGLAHPALAADPTGRQVVSPGAMSHFTQRCPTCSPTLFPEDNLTDGAALMAHDGVALAVGAIRHASEVPGGQGSVEVTSSSVIQLLYQTTGLDTVTGATGRISMTSCGEAQAKLFPLLSFGPDGVPTLARAEFARGPSRCEPPSS